MDGVDRTGRRVQHVGDLTEHELDPVVEAELRACRSGELDVGGVGVDTDGRAAGTAGVGQPERRVADPTSQVEDRPRPRCTHEHRRELHHGRPCREQPAPVLALVLLRPLEHVPEPVTSAELDEPLLDLVHHHSLPGLPPFMSTGPARSG